MVSLQLIQDHLNAAPMKPGNCRISLRHLMPHLMPSGKSGCIRASWKKSWGSPRLKRRRWTKDGRLPTSGAGLFRGGQHSIHFPLYPPTKIAMLAQQPEKIEAWRQEDEGRPSTEHQPKRV